MIEWKRFIQYKAKYMSKKLKAALLRFKLLLSVSAMLNLFLVFVIGLYIFSSAIDEWVIQHSLKRLCSHQKEVFSGEQYSPAYLCTFLPSPE